MQTSSSGALPRAPSFADYAVHASAVTLTQVHSTAGTAASPDAFSRTPLFGASEKKRALLAPGEEVVVIDDPDGYQVLLAGGLKSSIPGPYGMTGQPVSCRFDQTDYTVFLGLLRYVKGQLGVSVEFEPYKFAKSLGLQDSETNVRVLFGSIARMAETRLAVRCPIPGSQGHFDYAVGRLVSSVGYSTQTRKYSIQLDPRLAALFKPANFCALNWEQRLAIKSSLGKWLHAELSSHESGRWRWTHKLQEAYGSKSTPSLFKLRLKEAAAEVAVVTQWDIRFEKPAKGPNEKLVCHKPALH